MKKTVITDAAFMGALASGLYNLYRLSTDGQYVLAIVHDKGHSIVPIIGGRAYVTDVDMEMEETIGSLVSELVRRKVYSELGRVEVRYRAAPAHSMRALSIVGAVGVAKSPDADRILTDAGYEIDSTEMKAGPTKDYSALLASNPEAARILEETKRELAAVDATFESLGREVQVAYWGAMNSNNGGIFFEGPTGTGKTFACKVLAAQSNAPLKNIQITYGTTVEDLMGSFIPNEDASVSEDAVAEIGVANSLCTAGKITVAEFSEKVREIVNREGGSSKWAFVPGPLLIAYSEGWQIYLDEINYGQAGVIACINQMTDGTPRITYNGRTYRRNPNFVIYMTMNPGYEGTDPLNVALKNRFAKVNVPALPKSEFSRRMVCYSKGLGHSLSVEFFNRLYDFAGGIETLGNGTEYHENVKFSIRNAQRLCDIILAKPRTLDEFRSAVAVQYLNDLTTDNDNSEKVERLKEDPTIVNQVRGIYECYDFANVPVANVAAGLASMFTEVEEGKPTDDDALIDDKDLDTMLSDL